MDAPEKDLKIDPAKNVIAGFKEDVVKVNGNAYQTLQAATAPLIEPEKHSINESIDLLHNKGPLQNLRTYESDLADATKKKDVSRVKIAIEEAAQKQRLKPKSNKISKNILMLIVSFALIAAGLAIFALFILKIIKPDTSTTQRTLVSDQIIAVDSSTDVLIDPDSNTLTALISQRGSLNSLDLGKIASIHFVVATTSSNTKLITNVNVDGETVFDDFYSQAPSWLARALATSYIAGYYNDNGSLQPFFIFKTTSYENAFAGMLKWESTIPTDLAPLFAASVMQNTTVPTIAPIAAVATTTSTSTTKTKSTTTKTTKSTTTATTTTPVVAPTPSPATQFEDVVIKNKDVRELVNQNQIPLLFYSFPDKGTLVITTSQDALQEIFSRLVTSQFAQ